MQQQRQISTNGLRASSITPQLQDGGTVCPPPFFISRRETGMPQTSVKMLQTEVIEICQLSERNPEHIHPGWISKSKDSANKQIDCKVDTGAGCNVISPNHKFFRHKLSPNDVKADKDKKEAILNMSPPNSEQK